MVKVRSLISVSIAGILLFVVIRSLDIQTLYLAVTGLPLPPVLLGLSMSLMIVPVMAFRWRFLLAEIGSPPGYSTCIVDHWSGMSIGWATPSNIGWDAYRATRMTLRMGRAGHQVAIILIEKFGRLSACILIFIAMFTLQPSNVRQHLVEEFQIIEFLPVLVISAIVVVGLILRYTEDISEYLRRKVAVILVSWTGADESEMEDVRYSIRSMGGVVVISMFPVAIVSLGHLIFFSAMDIQIPFIQILLVVSILDIVFSLPISFGSLGVREVGYILAYGAFGISPESAVLVSTLNLIGILNNSLIGAVFSRWSIDQSPDYTSSEE